MAGSLDDDDVPVSRVWNTVYWVGVTEGPNGAQQWNDTAPPELVNLGPDYWLGLKSKAE